MTITLHRPSVDQADELLRTLAPSEQPFWQTTPCPTWCQAEHLDADHPDDRDGASCRLSARSGTYGGTSNQEQPKSANLNEAASVSAGQKVGRQGLEP
jgi:hypothetical protein